MKKIFKKNYRASTPEVKNISPAPVRKAFCKRGFAAAAALFLASGSLLAFSGCGKTVDYFDCVSELRSNVLVAAKGNLAICAYATDKETPYAADGIKRAVSSRAEVYLTAPTGIDSYDLSFTYEGKEYGGDMSFDNIRLEYFFSCTLDISAAKEIVFTVACEDTTVELTAESVVTEEVMAPRDILEKVRAAENERFKAMTDKNGFAGEIYMRLIYEDTPYYYVGVIDREGRICALLVDSKDGKILAKREM